MKLGTYEEWLESELDVPIEYVYNFDFYQLYSSTLQFSINELRRRIDILSEETFDAISKIKNGFNKMMK